MYARIATFHGTPNRVREASRVTEEITPEMQQTPGFQGSYLIVDANSGKALGVSFWEDEEEARRGPSTSIQERVREAVGATQMATIDTYEVGFEIVGGMAGSRFLRVSEYHGSPSRIEDGIQATKNTEPSLKAMQGFQHVYFLVDRKSGRAMTLAFWDSEGSLTRSASGVTPLRDSIARSLGASDKPIVESFEVAGMISRRARKAA